VSAVKGIAAVRAAFGIVMVSRPQAVMRVFGITSSPEVAILARGIGARDLAGALQLLAGPVTEDEARRFLRGRAAVDLFEIGAFLAAARRGRRHWSTIAVPLMAVGSALFQTRLAARLPGGDG